MVPAIARIVFNSCFFFLVLTLLSHHVAAVSFSFDFSNTSSYSPQDLRFEGDAALKGHLVDLTCNSKEPNMNYHCKGRMSYNHPVVLYDNITGEVASFATTFTFAIHMLPNTTDKGDGMAFFLSDYPSRLPPESSSNVLGLTNSGNTSATGAERFVAVEFDTHENTGMDPTGASDHIGIDINSIISASTTRLPSYSLNGTMTATITFDNATQTLEATLHFVSARSLPAFRVKTRLPDKLDDVLPPEVVVGFSASTGGQTELHQVQSWSFNSTMALRDDHGPVGGDNRSVIIIGGAVAGALALVAVAVAIWWIVSRYMCRRTQDSFGSGTRLKQIKYRELSVATEGFSDKKEIGRGAFGVVYRGRLETMETEVAVKKIITYSREGFNDFRAELGAIEATAHMNVVRLEGWCCHINSPMFCWSHMKNIKLLLVYEHVPNGTLQQHLHPEPQQPQQPEKLEVVLTWARRYKIARGLGSAVRYLHHECNDKYIVHRDIKPGNILLDNEFNAKLADFGLSRIAKDGRQTSVPTVMGIGTPEYMDPLDMKPGDVSLRRSSDVYSFGIVLLEIAHGKNNLEHVRDRHADLLAEKFVDVAADEKLAGQFVRTEMERVLLLGLWCCEPEQKRRPSMVDAMHYLDPAPSELARSQKPPS